MIDREKVLELVKEIYFGPPENSLITPLLDKIDSILPDARTSDLIFQDKRNLNPEQVVDEAIQRQVDFDNKNYTK